MTTQQRLNAMGVGVEERGNLGLEMPDHAGCLVAWNLGTPDRVLLVAVRSDIGPLTREDYLLWAERAFKELLEDGPLSPPWFDRSDGGLQSWARLRTLEQWAETGYSEDPLVPEEGPYA